MNKGTTFTNSTTFAMMVIAILLFGTDVGTSDLFAVEVMGQENVPIPSVRYTSSGPIRINSNTEFASSPAVSSGDGSKEDPWVIDGFEINGSGKGCGIYIGNTTDHFIIRNCYIYHTNGSSASYYWNAGILIYNVKNGTLSGNDVTYSGGCGVYIRDSAKITIDGNDMMNNNQGLMIDHSDHNLAKGNNASRNSQNGIVLSSSDHCIVEENIAYYNVWGYGIDVYSSFLNEVMGNIVRNNLHDGIHNQVSWNNNITDNIVEGNENGIVFYSSTNSNITDNYCAMNIKTGIYLHQSHHNNVSSNDCNKNPYIGIYVKNSYDNFLSDNSLKHNNGSGIYLSNSKRIVIEENILSENEDRGVWLDSLSSNNIVHHNDVEKNEFGIILTEQSNDNTIRDNNVQENDHGIRIYDSDNNMIYHNMILENPDQSLDDGTGNRWNADYPVCGNYWSDHSGSDQFNGISQDVLGADGISDTPYSNILGAAGSIDRYPLQHKGMIGADVSPPTSSMDIFDIYTSDPTMKLAANAQDEHSEVVSVEFWYQYRSFSGTWSLWKKHSTDMTDSDGWSVEFVFPDGEGYYQFKSRARDLIGHYEADKVNAEAQCCYDNTPPVLIDNSSDIARTGENYLPRYLLSDNSGIHDVHFIYRFGQGGWSDQPTIGYLDGYIPIPVPLNSTEPLQFNFTATDLAGNNASLFKEVPVLDVIAPNASAGTDITIDEDTIVTFNGSGSFDNIGILNHTWSFMDGGGTNIVLYGQGPAYLFDLPGVYSITLSVLDGANNTASDVLVVTVLDITDPVADAGHDISVTEGTVVILNGSGSTDNVDITELIWTFNDGLNGVTLQGALVSHNFSKVGNYTVTLTVKDAAGNTGYDTMLVRVNELPSDDDDNETDDDEDDDEDDDGPDDDDNDVKWVLSPLICSGIALFLIVLLLIVVVIIAVLSGRKGGRGPSEE